MLKTKTNGKLYLIGEYNIMKPGHHAILIPSNKTLDVAVHKHSDYRIHENDEISLFHYDGNQVCLNDDKKVYTKVSIQTAFDYLNLKSIPIHKFELFIENHLKDDHKYGLGSSSAIFIGVINTILKFHGLNLDPITLFKLGVIAQKRAHALSSGGDLALCAFGVSILYQSFDSGILFDDDLERLLNCKWPLLHIDPLPKIGLEVAVGYSGISYQTKKSFLEEIQADKSFETFIKVADPLVMHAHDYMIKKDIAALGNVINTYQEHLNRLSQNQMSHFMIEPLKRMIAASQGVCYGVKISGAGYGDCVIGIIKNKKLLIDKWHQEGFLLLDMIRI